MGFVRRSRLLWLAMFLLVPGMALAASLADRVTFYSVTFHSPAVHSEPCVRDGTVRLQGPDKSLTAVDVLSPAVDLRPVIRRASASFRLAGPWRIGLLDVSDPELKLAEIRRDPRVAHAELISNELQPVIGEEAAVSFPPLSDRPYFCRQSQLHGPFVGAPELAGEPCLDPWDDWNHDADMDLPQAWAITQGDTNVMVAVIDVGVQWPHPALGGIAPAVSVPDSLPYYNQGVIYRNWGEQLGDISGDGYPGLQGVDDDGDGLIDEDSMRREPGNTPEADVAYGVITGVQDSTITDANANYVENELVGRFFFPYEEWNYIYTEIVSNTATTITTRKYCFDYAGTVICLSWEEAGLPVGPTYRIGNLIDDDNDGEVDDNGYLADLANDDDENGYNDDLRGYDFLDVEPYEIGAYVPLPNEDFMDEDNDPRSVGGHGTNVSGLVATSPLSPLMGVAPNVKILPIRAGYTFVSGANLCGDQGINYDALVKGLAYARDLKSDFMVTATVAFGEDVLEQVNLATAEDILHFQGSWGSWQTSTNSVLVTGVNDHDALNNIGNGAWSQVAARSAPLWVVDCRVSCPVSVPYTYSYFSESLDTPSLCGPLAAGVAALMKSAYPHWSAEDIRAKLLSSVDDIYTIPEDPDLNAAYEAEQLLGTGRINAYKALTFYGQVGTISADTTWTNTVWVSGDIEIPAGATLRVAPGTRIVMAQDDLLDKGVSPNRVEFLVEGTVLFQGTAAEPIVIDMLRDEGTDARWGPFTFSNYEAKTRGVFEHVVFKHAHQVAVKGTVPLVDRVAVRFDGCSFEDVTWGVDFQAMALGDSLEISGCAFRGIDPTIGTAVSIESANAESDYLIAIGGGTTISNYATGVLVRAHRQARVTATTIDSCSLGMIVGTYNVLAPTLGPDLVITNAQILGMYVGAGQALLSGVTVANSGMTGLYFYAGASPTFVAPATSVTGCAMHGVVLDGISNSAHISNLNIADCGDSGLRVIGCSPYIDGPLDIQYCDGSAVYCDGASPYITGITMSYNDIGLNAANGSSGYLRHSTVANGAIGVMVGATDTPNIGDANDYGVNDFNKITSYYAVNLNENAELLMIGNCYNNKTGLPGLAWV